MSFFTYPRILNFSRLVSGYMISRLRGRVSATGKPLAVSIEPTNRCNLHCHECPSGMKTLTREAGSMDMKLFRSVLDQLLPELAWLTLYFQGEPYLNPLFFDFIAYARSKEVYVSASTNGHFLNPAAAGATVRSGLDRIIISVDGTDQETYSSYRAGGSLVQVISGIRNLSSARNQAGKKKPMIIIQFLVLKTNQHQIKEIQRKGLEWGGDKVEIKTAQFNDFEKGNPLMPDPGRYSRYIGQNPVRIKNSHPRHCFRMWSSCVITWDGRVVPCCFDKDASICLGSLKEKSFTEIWRDRDYQDFRLRILKERESIPICRNCTEGMGISRWI